MLERAFLVRQDQAFFGSGVKMADITKKSKAEDGEPLAPRRRNSPVQFFQEVRREMAKVTWPTWKETWLTTVMVFIMVALTMAFFFVVDTILRLGELYLIGAKHL